MDLPFVKRIYRISREKIAYMRFVLESYDGLMFMRTLDRHAALIEVGYPPSRELDADPLLKALQREFPMTEVFSCPPELRPPL